MNKETLVVMGNGPSLADVDFNLLSKFDTFGLNSAYKAYYKLGWWPTYHGSFDYLITRENKQQFKKLIKDAKSIKKFFYLESISDDSRCQLIKLLPFGSSNKWNTTQEDFLSFNDGGNSGVNACQVGVCLGYKKIILVGVDCNYPELDNFEKLHDGKFRLNKKIESNQWHWFEDYLEVGDVINPPNVKKFHLEPWIRFASKAFENGVEVINCSLQSKLNCFKKSTIEKQLDI